MGDDTSKMAAVSVRLNPLGIAVVVGSSLCVLVYIVGIPSFFKSEPKIVMRELLSVSIDLAKRGGIEVKKVHENPPGGKLTEQSKGHTKEGATMMVTEGDKKSHQAIIYGFNKVYPALKVISEEANDLKPVNLKEINEPQKNNPDIPKELGDTAIPIHDIIVWIDPLDATKEYTESLLEFVTVMVCVAVRGRPTIGVIHYPFKDKTVWGWVGYGFSRNIAEEKKDDVEGEKPLRVIRSRSHAGKVDDTLKNALGEDVKIINAGGAGYKTIEVIKGNADAYVHQTRIKKWDICAGNAIIMSKGGKMTTLEDKSIDYSPTSSYINDNGILATMKDHDRILSKIRPIFEKKRKADAKKKKVPTATLR